MKVLSLLLLAAAIACAPASQKLEPLAAPEPGDSCPAGRQSWALEIRDQRADRDRVDGPTMTTLVSESIRRSFPGCRWEAAAAGSSGPVIRIEVWQFRSAFEDQLWEAQAIWSVEVGREAGGASQFEVQERVSRPNYQGTDNQVQSLRDVFEAAMKKTVEELRAVPSG